MAKEAAQAAVEGQDLPAAAAVKKTAVKKTAAKKTTAKKTTKTTAKKIDQTGKTHQQAGHRGVACKGKDYPEISGQGI